MKRKKIRSLLLMSLLTLVMAFGAACGAGNSARREEEPLVLNGITELTDKVGYDKSADFAAEAATKLPESVRGGDEISLIVMLGEDSVVDSYLAGSEDAPVSTFAASDKARSIRKSAAREQNAFLKKLKKAGVGFEVEETYQTVFNGVAVKTKAKYYDKIASLVGEDNILVGDTYLEPKVEVSTNQVKIDGATGIFDSSDSGYDGTGTVVAVIDSGFDYTHTAYQNMPDASKIVYDQDAIREKVSATNAAGMTAGLKAEDVYINDKVPFSYDYADKDPDVYPFTSEHGTHVAGIIAGEDDTIKGVAPGAQLVLMKVFSDSSEGARTSDILAAVEDCVTLGVDVVNMSLGSSCGFTRESDLENYVYDKVKAAGISLIVAASNDYSSGYGSEANGNYNLTSNPDSGTIGSPATYESSLAVASISGERAPYLIANGDTAIFYNESSDSAGENFDFMERVLGNSTTGAYQYVTVPGYGYPYNYTGLDVKNKIALVKRGENSFEQKVQIAAEQGAKGCIIYNNTSGEIKMSIGNKISLGAISVTQEVGEALAARQTGTLLFSKNNVAGPFMSDFSSWGPTPDLRLKPEITAHGGNILSSVPGNRYDKLSGTSMASPNMAGVATIIRQYIKEHFTTDPVAVTEMTNRLVMSTADIALNPDGNPYSPRKQGAGLANLLSSINTGAYLYVEGIDKTKLELGDDPAKTGVYDMKLKLKNITGKPVSYVVGSRMMTETVSSVKTDAGKTTVAEKSRMLTGTKTELSVTGGTQDGMRVTVAAGEEAELSITLTLSDADKKYLDESFENGMYVEGFITLSDDDQIDLSAPVLAFYGDWTAAPIFDKTYYETDPDDKNLGLDEKDKVKPDAYATRPVGNVATGGYIMYMGAYAFEQDPTDTPVVATPDKSAITTDISGIHSIYGVFTGQMRGAKSIDVTITDTSTGRVVFDKTRDNVRKSFSQGGEIGNSIVQLDDFNILDAGLSNNSKYEINLTAKVDYRDGGIETNKRNTFTSQFYADFESPVLKDVKYSTEYDKTTKKTKYFAEFMIYDNHYAQSIRLGRLSPSPAGSPYPFVLDAFGKYMTPVYGERNSTTPVRVEITDYLDRYRESAIPNTMALIVEDYALNENVYAIPLPDDIEAIRFEERQVTISENQVYDLRPLLYPEDQWGNDLVWTSSDESVVKVEGGSLTGLSAGSADITATCEKTSVSATLTVNVLGPGEPGYVKYDPPSATHFSVDSFKVLTAFEDASEVSDIGEAGFVVDFGASASLSLYPSEQVQLSASFRPAGINAEVRFESSKSSVATVDSRGVITAEAEGSAGITARLYVDGKETSFTQRVSITVKDPFITNAYMLIGYKGKGGLVEIPDDRGITEISQFAFSLVKYVAKKPSEIDAEDPFPYKAGPVGNHTVTAVVVPEGVKKIGSYAFANCTALESVQLPASVRSIGSYAFSMAEEYGNEVFYNSSLKRINLENVQFLGVHAFEGCEKLESVDLTSVKGIGDYAFMGCKSLTEADLSGVQTTGAGAFQNCTSLRKVKVDTTKLGAGVFYNCPLAEVSLDMKVVPEAAFAGSALTKVTLGKSVESIGENSFRGTRVAEFEVAADNPFFAASADRTAILSRDGSELVLVAPASLSGAYTVPASVKSIGKSAFAGTGVTAVTFEAGSQLTGIDSYAFTGCGNLSSVALPASVRYVGDYAFAGCGALSSVTGLDYAGLTVGAYAFAATGLTGALTLGEDVVAGPYAFSLTGVTSLSLGANGKLGEGAFADCAALTSVNLAAAANVGARAFAGCTALTSFDFSKVTELGAYAFEDSGITSADLSDLTAVPAGLFRNAKALATVRIPSAVSVGEAAFDGCNALVSAEASTRLKDIASYAFRSTALNSFQFGGVVSIGEGAFFATNLTEAKLSKAASVGFEAFAQNGRMLSVTVASGAQIAPYAFYYRQLSPTAPARSALTEVKNIEGASYIGAAAFMNASLSGPILLTNLESLGAFAFGNNAVTKVAFGDKLAYVGANPFAGNLGFTGVYKTEVVEGFEIEREVDTFTLSESVFVDGGAIYTTLPSGGFELVCYPQGKTDLVYTVAEGTARIADSAAFGNQSLREITLPLSLKTIGTDAFTSAEPWRSRTSCRCRRRLSRRFTTRPTPSTPLKSA